MNEMEKTTEKLNDDPILQAIAELSKKFDGLEGKFDNLNSKFDNLNSKFDNLENRFDGLEGKFDGLENRLNNFEESVNAQFEAIRTGLVANNAAFERLVSKVYLVSANLTEMMEELKLRSREGVL